MRRALLFLAGILSTGLAAMPAARPAEEGRAGRYRIQPNDTVEVQYRYTPEYNASATVRPDGYIALPLVGDVRIEGHTVEEAAAAVARQAGSRLRDPEVTVSLKDFVKTYFVVAGQVERPGRYELRGDITVVEALAIGGWFRYTAKHSQVLLVRRVDADVAEVRVIDMKKGTQRGRVHEDIHVQAGDTLIVPQNFISKIERYVNWTGMGAFLASALRP